jgi:hypothetical protein
MGVDCCIYVPSDARLDDIVKVMAIAAGAPHQRVNLSGGAWYVKTEGARVESGNNFLALCPHIHFDMKTIDGVDRHFVMFHAEASGQHGAYRLLMPRSTPFWIAMGLKLITFFGGKMDANDSDSNRIDFRRKKPRKWNDPEDGIPWHKLQEDMEKVKPISIKDMVAVRHLAGYDVGIHNGINGADGYKVEMLPKPEGASKMVSDNAQVEAILDHMEKDAMV